MLRSVIIRGEEIRAEDISSIHASAGIVTIRFCDSREERMKKVPFADVRLVDGYDMVSPAGEMKKAFKEAIESIEKDTTKVSLMFDGKHVATLAQRDESITVKEIVRKMVRECLEEEKRRGTLMVGD